jgi:hypothetical protein
MVMTIWGIFGEEIAAKSSDVSGDTVHARNEKEISPRRLLLCLEYGSINGNYLMPLTKTLGLEIAKLIVKCRPLKRKVWRKT